MRIWNLFEQSGHFKDVEKEMGYDGVDIDCVKTEHTDYVMDLLGEIVDLEGEAVNKKYD